MSSLYWPEDFDDVREAEEGELPAYDHAILAPRLEDAIFDHKKKTVALIERPDGGGCVKLSFMRGVLSAVKYNTEEAVRRELVRHSLLPDSVKAPLQGYSLRGKPFMAVAFGSHLDFGRQRQRLIQDAEAGRVPKHHAALRQGAMWCDSARLLGTAAKHGFIVTDHKAANMASVPLEGFHARWNMSNPEESMDARLIDYEYTEFMEPGIKCQKWDLDIGVTLAYASPELIDGWMFHNASYPAHARFVLESIIGPAITLPHVVFVDCDIHFGSMELSLALQRAMAAGESLSTHYANVCGLAPSVVRIAALLACVLVGPARLQLGWDWLLGIHKGLFHLIRLDRPDAQLWELEAASLLEQHLLLELSTVGGPSDMLGPQWVLLEPTLEYIRELVTCAHQKTLDMRFHRRQFPFEDLPQEPVAYAKRILPSLRLIADDAGAMAAHFSKVPKQSLMTPADVQKRIQAFQEGVMRRYGLSERAVTSRFSWVLEADAADYGEGRMGIMQKLEFTQKCLLKGGGLAFDSLVSEHLQRGGDENDFAVPASELFELFEEEESEEGDVEEGEAGDEEESEAGTGSVAANRSSHTMRELLRANHLASRLKPTSVYQHGEYCLRARQPAAAPSHAQPSQQQVQQQAAPKAQVPQQLRRQPQAASASAAVATAANAAPCLRRQQQPASAGSAVVAAANTALRLRRQQQPATAGSAVVARRSAVPLLRSAADAASFWESSSAALPTMGALGISGQAAKRDQSRREMWLCKSTATGYAWHPTLDVNRACMLHCDLETQERVLAELLRSARDAVLDSGLLDGSATTIYLYLQPLRAIGQLGAELDEQWEAEGLLQRDGSGRFQLSAAAARIADASPLVFKFSKSSKNGKWGSKPAYNGTRLREGLTRIALRPTQQGSGEAIACTGADGQACSFTAVGSHLWGESVCQLLSSRGAASRMPVHWSTQLAAGDGPDWQQHARPLP